MWPLEPVIDVLTGTFAEATAEETSEALTVGTPPIRSGGFAVVPLGTLQLAIGRPQTGGGAAGAVLTVNVSLAELPVSNAPMKR